jgi:hypothetical protein
MPRPKSEITNLNSMVGIKLTPSQQLKWKELGGAKWLREYLCHQIEIDRAKEMGRVLGVKQAPAPDPKKSKKELYASLDKIIDDAVFQIKKVIA